MAVIAFYIFALLLLSSATMVILARNPVHAVLFLILAFFNAAGLFILLGAEFVAMILVIVYVGAVAVLFLFVVMMLNVKPQLHSLWFTGNQWQELRISSREVAINLILWFVSTVCLWNITNWLVEIFLPQSFVLSYQNIFSVLSNSTSYSYNSAVHDNLKIIPVVLLIACVFLANIITVNFTQRKFIDTVRRLFKSLPISIFIGGILILELIVASWCWMANPGVLTPNITIEKNISNTHALAPLIYLDYMLVFLISGLILLVAMIGSIVLTLYERPDNKRQNISRQLSRRKSETLEIRKVNVGEGME